MTRLRIIGTVVLSLALCDGAQAGWKVDRATAIAGIVWRQPCPVQVRFASAPDAAWAAMALRDSCTVVLRSDREPWAWEELCTAVLHEVGHLAGMDHSSRMASVMHGHQIYAQVVDVVNGRRTEEWLGTDPRCRARGRPYLERHGLL